MTNEEPLPKKVRLSESDMKTLTREELCVRWKQHEAYVQVLEAKYADLSSNDVTGLKESEEKLKQQQQESARRENILVMRLATKEQEMQECTTQIQYLKQVQQPSAAQLRSSMVDPAINLFFLKMKAELEQTKDKLEQAQNELSAWKFTPDSPSYPLTVQGPEGVGTVPEEVVTPFRHGYALPTPSAQTRQLILNRGLWWTDWVSLGQTAQAGSIPRSLNQLLNILKTIPILVYKRHLTVDYTTCIPASLPEKRKDFLDRI
uniref:Pre-mRNA-splicing regulator WTAP n=1 Tax=Myripristis murdjan TaxID=586833 RepID=A0A668AVJ0_9TELE